jgi:hypothetical protein
MTFMIGPVSARYRTTTFDAIDEIPVVGGALRWKPVRRTLGVTAFGINAYVPDAGEALAHLNRAYEADPERIAKSAHGDADLEPLRDMGGYPPFAGA